MNCRQTRTAVSRTLPTGTRLTRIEEKIGVWALPLPRETLSIVIHHKFAVHIVYLLTGVPCREGCLGRQYHWRQRHGMDQGYENFQWKHSVWAVGLQKWNMMWTRIICFFRQSRTHGLRGHVMFFTRVARLRQLVRANSNGLNLSSLGLGGLKTCRRRPKLS